MDRDRSRQARGFRRARAGRLVALAALAAAASCTAFEPHPLAPAGSSIGATDDGWLVDGVPVPASADGLRAYRDAERRYGSRQLAAVLAETAAHLAARFPGAVLRVGDLSERAGGKVRGHRSHRSGRDVDLLFFVTEADGTPATRPRFGEFGADGLAVGARAPRRLDAERNWALVEHLLEVHGEAVQWIFVSHGVKAEILEWALASGAAPETVARALEVLHQPGDSAPHDDHFHVRLYCDPADREWGCLDEPPIWPWVRRDYDRLEHARTDDAVLLEWALGPL